MVKKKVSKTVSKSSSKSTKAAKSKVSTAKGNDTSVEWGMNSPRVVKSSEQVPTVQTITPVKTVAEKIWDDIKDRPIEMFALPGQTPAKYCSPITVEPGKLYLTFTGGLVLSSIETAFKSKYDVELVDRFIVLSYKSPFSK